MSTEENAPGSSRVNIAAFREAARKHNNKIRREKVLRTIPKILGIVSLLVAAIVAICYMTQWLLAIHSTESRLPPELLILMAAIGATLIVVGVAAIIKLIINIILSLNESVGFHPHFVSIGGLMVGVTVIGVAVITTLYLAVFYNF